MNTGAHDWRGFAGRGVVALLVGVVAVLWPGTTLLAMTLFLASYALVDGALALAIGARHRLASHGILLGLDGLAGLALGAGALIWPPESTSTLTSMVAVWAVVTGALEIGAAWRLHPRMGGRVVLALAGFLSIALGLSAWVWPHPSPTVLASMLGTYGAFFGTFLLVFSARLRRATPHPHLQVA